MRHYKKGRKLGTDSAHTKAMKKSLVSALFLNDRIKTIEARAKEIRPDVDRIITWAKRGDLHSRRLAIAQLGDAEIVREVFERVKQGQFADRKGGYTRILKLGKRKGDSSEIVIMELVTEAVKKDTKSSAAKTSSAKSTKAATAKSSKAAPKADAKASEKKTTAKKPAAKKSSAAKSTTKKAAPKKAAAKKTTAKSTKASKDASDKKND